MKYSLDNYKLNKYILFIAILSLIIGSNAYAMPDEKNKQKSKKSNLLVPALVIDKDRKQKNKKAIGKVNSKSNRLDQNKKNGRKTDLPT